MKRGDRGMGAWLQLHHQSNWCHDTLGLQKVEKGPLIAASAVPTSPEGDVNRTGEFGAPESQASGP